MKYEITNTASGHSFGVYEAETPEGALDVMAQDAGYADHADACTQSNADGSDLRAVAVSAPESMWERQHLADVVWGRVLHKP